MIRRQYDEWSMAICMQALPSHHSASCAERRVPLQRLAIPCFASFAQLLVAFHGRGTTNPWLTMVRLGPGHGCCGFAPGAWVAASDTTMPRGINQESAGARKEEMRPAFPIRSHPPVITVARVGGLPRFLSLNLSSSSPWPSPASPSSAAG